jgi:hypothetical protein
MGETEPFKVCPQCGKSWRSLFELVEDVSLHVNGYQASFIDPDNGLVFFTHIVEHCRSTIAVEVQHLRHMYNGPEIEMHNFGRETCPGFCLDMHELEDCNQVCNMHWVRAILHYLRRHEMPPHLKPGPDL